MGITALIIAGFVVILLIVKLAIKSGRHRQPSERISPRFSSANAVEDLGPSITGPQPEEPWPFYAKRLLSQPEQVLYHRLCSALPECLVLAQVHLPRLLGVKRGHNYGTWNNRIDRLSLDYVICRKDASVLVAIELDDSSHESDKRQETGRKKAQALEAAGVRLIRWHVSHMPDVDTLRRTLLDSAASTAPSGLATAPIGAH